MVDEVLQRAAGRADPLPTRLAEVSEPGSRYIDFLIPGVIGLNLMSGGMWGVGFSLVDMRIKRLLKRLLATPMRRADLMASHMAIRVVFMFIESRSCSRSAAGCSACPWPARGRPSS